MSTQAHDAGLARAMHAQARAIEARDLVKTYPKEIRALDGLSFAVEEGTVFGLLGPNGAGKSTTVKILTTLARPDSGLGQRRRARRAAPPGRGAPRHRRRRPAIRRRPGRHRPGEPAAPGRLYGLRGRDLGRRADELLDRFDLADAAGRHGAGPTPAACSAGSMWRWG